MYAPYSPKILFASGAIFMLANCEPRTPAAAGEARLAQPEAVPAADSAPLPAPRPLVAVREVPLTEGFSLRLKGGKQVDGFCVYEALQIRKDGRLLWTDTADEYEFNEPFYPLLLPNTARRYDLLVEVNRRPGMSHGRVFRIRDGKVAGREDVPVFVAPAGNQDQDPALEYAGYWSFFETWDEQQQPLTSYNPLVFYEQTSRGLQLDSALTRQVNQRIYGQYHGFRFRQDLPQPVSIVGRLDDEVARVKRRAGR
ncbi:hypothetical protein [Hymenobacter cellulosilyticus]|uniref:Uncharacterized protein n=1 Tax=Hymenobacter cellulosilyticus TaxID=2932248 RepID=A0A8T9Q1M4_9BACT|nr:hypothetical protein [Hymenobacter cellulosilyticus]UOQ70915.1 hypothetical protein MUN79_19865 [Hymenobacter cellulosilyticus]